ncbi:hypothetical protein EVB31_036 [Rhizobium phage RHph_TM29]|nr:hypothetical protein EVB31_036 [Rhizobium phage RHph_TM29]
MARSTKTRAEFEAMAMLLGLEYDARDHTFTMFGASAMVTEHLILCADTLKPVSITDFSYRQTKVKEGRLGPADDI